MLRQENIVIDGINFVHSYSDENYYIQNDSGVWYEDATDLAELHRVYFETDVLIEHDEPDLDPSESDPDIAAK